MKVTPVSPTPAITFKPSSIVFRNYTETTKTFKVKVSNSVNGTFLIKYEKTEGNNIFYNDIPEENLTIVAPTRNYWIKIKNVNKKSVGIFIPIRIKLEKANSKDFTILYSHNCSQEYVFYPNSFITAPAGERTITVYIRYDGNKIPEMCILDFKISSLSTNNY